MISKPEEYVLEITDRPIFFFFFIRNTDRAMIDNSSFSIHDKVNRVWFPQIHITTSYSVAKVGRLSGNRPLMFCQIGIQKMSIHTSQNFWRFCLKKSSLYLSACKDFSTKIVFDQVHHTHRIIGCSTGCIIILDN